MIFVFRLITTTLLVSHWANTINAFSVPWSERRKSSVFRWGDFLVRCEQCKVFLFFFGMHSAHIKDGPK